MADTENGHPPCKKRAAGREISRDNPGLDDEETEQETGTFQKASDEVLATRRIVKVRRQQPPAAASTNPFASIQLIPPVTESGVKLPEVTKEMQPVSEKPVSEVVHGKQGGDRQVEKEGDATGPKDETAKQVEEKKTNEPGGAIELNGQDETDKQAEEKKTNEPDDATDLDGKDETDEKVGENKTNGSGAELACDEEKSGSIEPKTKTKATDEKEATEGEETKKDNGPCNVSPSAATVPLSSFQQLSSTQNAFTGLSGMGFLGSSFSFGAGSGSLPGLNDKPSSLPTFSFNGTSNGSSSLFGTAAAMGVGRSEGSGAPSMLEVPVETGEEKEKVVYTADAVLFAYIDGGWKERGKGELKVNCSTAGDKRARLVMRAKGNYRLILNASLYPDMKLTNMDKKGITFVCMNSAGEGKDGLSTFALKFKDGSFVEEFRRVVNLHKGEKTTVSKTPENSPKGADD